MNASEALSRTVLLSRDFIDDGIGDEEIVAALLDTNVCIVADEINLHFGAGQSAVVTLATLCLAMGASVKLAFPDVETAGFQPPLTEAFLRRGIIELSRDRIPGVFARAAIQSSSRDLVFVLGDTPWHGPAHTAWRLYGSDWVGGLAPIDAPVARWVSELPFGGLVAAVMAADEPYKFAIRKLVAKQKLSFVEQQLAPVQEAAFSLAPNTTGLPVELELGTLDIVSGGAITTSALHCLLRVPGLGAKARLIEPDIAEISNLNRYPLLRRREVGQPKAEALQRWQSPGFSIEPKVFAFEPSKLSDLEPLGNWVIVGTDAIPPRWLAQSQKPAWLGIGATAHFLTLTSEHRAGLGCAGCLHPTDDGLNAVIPTVSFVSYWAGLLVASRLVLAAMGKPAAPERQALNLWPLRLDLPRSAIWQPVRRNPTCPIDGSDTTPTPRNRTAAEIRAVA